MASLVASKALTSADVFGVCSGHKITQLAAVDANVSYDRASPTGLALNGGSRLGAEILNPEIDTLPGAIVFCAAKLVLA